MLKPIGLCKYTGPWAAKELAGIPKGRGQRDLRACSLLTECVPVDWLQKVLFFTPQPNVRGAFSDGSSERAHCQLGVSLHPVHITSLLAFLSFSVRLPSVLSPSCFHLQFLQRAKLLARRLGEQIQRKHGSSRIVVGSLNLKNIVSCHLKTLIAIALETCPKVYKQLGPKESLS